MRVWDAALDQGPSGTIASLAILKLLCKTTLADRRCPVENFVYVLPADSSLSEHFLSSHPNISTDLHSLIDSPSCQSDEFFNVSQQLSTFFVKSLYFLYCLRICIFFIAMYILFPPSISLMGVIK